MRKMKDSGIDWIGEIPNEWKIERNKNLFYCSKNIVGRDWEKTQLLSLTTKGIKEKSFDDITGKVPENFDTYQVVEPNDIVMCLFDLDVSAVFSGISHYKGMISPAYKVLKCKFGLIPEFTDYWFNFVFVDRKFKTYSKNIRYTLNYDEFAMLPILQPTVSEQKRIAEYLYRKCSEIDSIINETEKTIEEYKTLKQSVITEAVTKGIRGDRPMKDSGISGYPKLPAEWKKYKLKQLVSVPITDGTHVTPTYADENNGYPFLSSKDVSTGKILWDNIKYITFDLHKELHRNFCPKRDDILLAKNGTTGIAAIVEERTDFDIYVTLARIRVIQNIVMPKFMLYAINSMLCKYQFNIHLLGIGVPNLHLEIINNTFVFIPSITEQQEIVNYLDQKCTEIDNLIEKKKALIEELKDYKKSLIYEYVTGKKEVPNAN